MDEVKSVQLVNFSVSMAQQLLAQPNMFCLIKGAEKNPRVESAFLQKLKNSYFDTFGVLFSDPQQQFSCPPTETLEEEIESCQLNPAKSTPFCNSYRLYQQALDWVTKQLVETNLRLARLTNKETEIYKSLDSLRGRLQEEVDYSDAVLGSDD